jgi:Flp pilus assembly protein TadD
MNDSAGGFDRRTRYVLFALAGILFLGVLPALSSAPARAQDPRVDRALERAGRLAKNRRTDAAFRELERAFRRAPTERRLVAALSSLALPDGPSTAAPQRSRERARVERLRALLETVPASAEDAVRRSVALSHASAIALLGNHRDAIDEIARAQHTYDPEASRVMRAIAALAIARDDLESAELALDTARRADGTDLALLVEIGRLALARGRPESAVIVFREALTRDPQSASVRRALAGAVLQSGDPSQAAALFRTLAEEEPSSARAHLDLSRALLEGRRYDRASRAARRALELDAADPEPAIVLGTALARLRRTADARAAFEEALRRRPGEPRAESALEALRTP